VPALQNCPGGHYRVRRWKFKLVKTEKMSFELFSEQLVVDNVSDSGRQFIPCQWASVGKGAWSKGSATLWLPVVSAEHSPGCVGWLAVAWIMSAR